MCRATSTPPGSRRPRQATRPPGSRSGQRPPLPSVPLSVSRFVDLWDRARTGIWFLPSAIVLLAALAALAAIAVEAPGGTGPGTGIVWPFGAIEAGAALTILSTVAASTITVAGVVFSITIVVLQLASAQFGPRLLRSFLADTGTQIVLGVIMGTFLYCLIVLATVGAGGGRFVPQAAVLGSLALGITDTGVIVYFIHHVATTIRVEHVLDRLGDDAMRIIAQSFPARNADSSAVREEVRDVPRSFAAGVGALDVHATTDGYVRRVDERGLLMLAETHDLIVAVERRAGDFVGSGTVLARVVAGPTDARAALGATTPVIPPALHDDLRHAFAIGSYRTLLQDPAFALQQLTEIAVRALSRAINDPFTAMAAIDRIAHALALAAHHPAAAAARFDAAGRLRLVTRPVTVAELSAAALDPIMRAGGDNVAIVSRVLGALAHVGERARDPVDRAYLAAMAEDVRLDAEARIDGRRDCEALARCCAEIAGRPAAPASRLAGAS